MTQRRLRLVHRRADTPDPRILRARAIETLITKACPVPAGTDPNHALRRLATAESPAAYEYVLTLVADWLALHDAYWNGTGDQPATAPAGPLVLSGDEPT